MSPLVCYQRNTYVCTYTLIGMNLLSYDMLGGFQKKVVAIKENNYDMLGSFQKKVVNIKENNY